MGAEKTEMTLDFADPTAIVLEKDAYGKISCRNKATAAFYKDVEIKLMFPLSNKSRYLAIYDEGREVVLIRNYRQIEPDSRRIVMDILEKHYFIPEITRVLKVREEYRLIHWHVDTNRGQLDFFTRTRNDIVVKGTRVFIRDIDSNRYVIKDYTKLSLQSQQELSSEI